MPVRAVIFDYGMVLSQAQEPSALNNLLAITGLDRDTFDGHYWTHRHAYDMGKLNGRTYWPKFAADGTQRTRVGVYQGTPRSGSWSLS